jgi:hypothetical protein
MCARSLILIRMANLVFMCRRTWASWVYGAFSQRSVRVCSALIKFGGGKAYEDLEAYLRSEKLY